MTNASPDRRSVPATSPLDPSVVRVLLSLDPNRLYGQELDLLEAVGFDLELAGAELLGRDVAGIGSSPAINQVRSLVTVERNRERLARHMAQTANVDATLTVDRILTGFCRGLLRAK